MTDKDIRELSRQLEADPKNLELREALLRLYERAGREDESLKTRIWLRYLKKEITGERIEAASSLDYKAAREIKQNEINLDWNNAMLHSLVKLLLKKEASLFACDCADRALLGHSLIDASSLSSLRNVIQFLRNETNLEKIKNAKAPLYKLIRRSDFFFSVSDNMSAFFSVLMAADATLAASAPHFSLAVQAQDFSLVVQTLATAQDSDAFGESFLDKAIFIAVASAANSAIKSATDKDSEIEWQRNRFAQYLVGEAK